MSSDRNTDDVADEPGNSAAAAGGEGYTTRPGLVRRFHQVAAELEQERPPKPRAARKSQQMFSRKRNRGKPAHFFAVLCASAIIAAFGATAIALFIITRAGVIEVADYRWGASYNDQALSSAAFLPDRRLAVVGTEGDGVHALETSTNFWRHYTHMSTGGALLDDRVRQVEFDADRNLYFLVADDQTHGLCKADPAFGQWRTLIGLDRFEGLKDSGEQVVAVRQVGDRLWLATSDLGVAEYELSTHRWAAFHNMEQRDLPSNATRDLAIAADGTVFVATDAGLAGFRGGKPVTLTGDDLMNSAVRQLAVHGNRLWFLTDTGGVGVVDVPAARASLVIADSNWKSTANVIVAAASVGDDRLWVTDAAGNVGRYDQRTRQWDTVALSAGGAEVKVLRVFGTGAAATPWLATTKGVFALPQESKVWEPMALPMVPGMVAFDVQSSGNQVAAAAARLEEPLDVFLSPAVAWRNGGAANWTRIQGGSQFPERANSWITATHDVGNQMILVTDGQRIFEYSQSEHQWLGAQTTAGPQQVLDMAARGNSLWKVLETNAKSGPTELVEVVAGKQSTILGGGNYPLAGAAITAADRDGAGRLWLGTKNAGIGVYDPIAHRWSQVKLVAEKLAQPSVSQIVCGKGKAWISTDAGLFAVDLVAPMTVVQTRPRSAEWIRGGTQMTSVLVLEKDGTLTSVDEFRMTKQLTGAAAVGLKAGDVTMAGFTGDFLLVATSTDTNTGDAFVYDTVKHAWTKLGINCIQLFTGAKTAWLLSKDGKLYAFDDQAENKLMPVVNVPPPVKQLVLAGGEWLAIANSGQVWRLSAAGAWDPVLTPPQAGPTGAELAKAKLFVALREELFVATALELWRFGWKSQTWTLEHLGPDPIAGVTNLVGAAGAIWAVTGDKLLRLTQNQNWQIVVDKDVASIRGGDTDAAGVAVIMKDGGLVFHDGKGQPRTLIAANPPAALAGQLIDAAVFGNRLYIATDKGLARLDSDLLTWSQVPLDLPVKAFIPSADGRDLWLTAGKNDAMLELFELVDAGGNFKVEKRHSDVRRATISKIDNTVQACIVTSKGAVNKVVNGQTTTLIAPAALPAGPTAKLIEGISAVWYDNRYVIAFSEGAAATYDPRLRKWDADVLKIADIRQFAVSSAADAEHLWACTKAGELIRLDKDEFKPVLKGAAITGAIVPLGDGVLATVKKDDEVEVRWLGADGAEQVAIAALPQGRSIKALSAKGTSIVVALLNDGVTRITLVDGKVQAETIAVKLPADAGPVKSFDEADRLQVDSKDKLWLRFGRDDRWSLLDLATGIAGKPQALPAEVKDALALLTNQGPMHWRIGDESKLVARRNADGDKDIPLTEHGSLPIDVIHDALLSKEGLWLATDAGVELVTANEIKSFPFGKMAASARLALGKDSIQLWTDDGLFDLKGGKWVDAAASLFDRDQSAGPLRVTFKAGLKGSPGILLEIAPPTPTKGDATKLNLTASGFNYQHATDALIHRDHIIVLSSAGLWSMPTGPAGAVEGLTPIPDANGAQLLMQSTPSLVAGGKVQLSMDDKGAWAAPAQDAAVGAIELTRSTRWRVVEKSAATKEWIVHVSFDGNDFSSRARPAGPQQRGFAWQNPQKVVPAGKDGLWCFDTGGVTRLDAKSIPDQIHNQSVFGQPLQDLDALGSDVLVEADNKWFRRDAAGVWKEDTKKISDDRQQRDRQVLNEPSWKWTRSVDGKAAPEISRKVGATMLPLSLSNAGRFSHDEVLDALPLPGVTVLATNAGLLLWDANHVPTATVAAEPTKIITEIWHDLKTKGNFVSIGGSTVQQLTVAPGQASALELAAEAEPVAVALARRRDALLDDGVWRVARAMDAEPIRWSDGNNIVNLPLNDHGFKHDHWKAFDVDANAIWAVTEVGLVEFSRAAGQPPTMKAIHLAGRDMQDVMLEAGSPRVFAGSEELVLSGGKFMADATNKHPYGRPLVTSPRWEWFRKGGTITIKNAAAAAPESAAEMMVNRRFKDDTVRAIGTEGSVLWIATDGGLIAHDTTTELRTAYRAGFDGSADKSLDRIARFVRASPFAKPSKEGDPSNPPASPATPDSSQALLAIGEATANNPPTVWLWDAHHNPPRWQLKSHTDFDITLVASTDAVEFRRPGKDDPSDRLQMTVLTALDSNSKPATKTVMQGGRFVTDIASSLAASETTCHLGSPLGVVELDANTLRYLGYHGAPADLSEAERAAFAPLMIFHHGTKTELCAMDKKQNIWRLTDNIGWEMPDDKTWIDEAWRVVDVPFWTWNRNQHNRCSFRMLLAKPEITTAPFKDGRFCFDALKAMIMDGSRQTLQLETEAGVAEFSAANMKMTGFRGDAKTSKLKQRREIPDGDFTWRVGGEGAGVVVERLDAMGQSAGVRRSFTSVPEANIRFFFVDQKGFWFGTTETMYLIKRP